VLLFVVVVVVVIGFLLTSPSVCAHRWSEMHHFSGVAEMYFT